MIWAGINMARGEVKNKLIWVYLPLLLVVAGILIALAVYGRSNQDGAEIIQITPEPQLLQPSVEPTQEAEPSASPEESPEPSPEASEEPVEGELSVSVLNGSGVPGAAGKVVDIIKGLGYSEVSAGNADNFDYEQTIVRYKSEYTDEADEIVEALDGYDVVKEELDDDSEYDIEIVVGVENS